MNYHEDVIDNFFNSKVFLLLSLGLELNIKFPSRPKTLLTFTWSKSAIKALENGVKCAQS